MSTPCIEWSGCRTRNGYGRQKVAGVDWLAHRWVMHQVQPLPAGAVVRHTCDNRACVNPEHLVVGTQSDNMVDKSLRGDRHATLKLRHAEVSSIRAALAAGESATSMAAAFGITRENVYHIRDRKTWKHL